MTFKQLEQSIRQRKFSPVYFLHGEEAYFIDAIVALLEAQVLTETEKAFNQTVFYGKDTQYGQIVDAARRYPVMAAQQLVILKEAQDCKTLKDLQAYLEKPTPSTVLVLAYKNGKYNLNSKFGKLLNEQGVIFEAKKLYDNQVADWIEEYLGARKLRIQSNAAQLVAEYLGADLSKVANELDKLSINAAPGAELTLQDIENQIGISKEYNVFELQRALAERNLVKANRIVNYFAENPRRNPLPVVLGALYNFFSKVYALHFVGQKSEKEQLEALALRSAYFLKDYRLATRFFTRQRSEQALTLLREYDLKSKGVDYNSTGKPEGALLQELVWRLLH